jgi:hypothetical protein
MVIPEGAGPVNGPQLSGGYQVIEHALDDGAD